MSEEWVQEIIQSQSGKGTSHMMFPFLSLPGHLDLLIRHDVVGHFDNYCQFLYAGTHASINIIALPN